MKAHNIILFFFSFTVLSLPCQEAGEVGNLHRLVNNKTLKTSHFYLTGIHNHNGPEAVSTGTLEPDMTRYYDFSFSGDGTGYTEFFYNSEMHNSTFRWSVEESEPYSIMINDVVIELSPPYIKYESEGNREDIIRLVRDSTGMDFVVLYSFMPKYDSWYQLFYRVKDYVEITE